MSLLGISSTSLFVAAVASVFVFGEQVLALRVTLGSWGLAGILALVTLKLGWTLTTVPSAPLMVLAGMVYGVWEGTLYVFLGGMAGAALTFFIGRTSFRGRFERWSERHEELRKAARFVEKHPVLCVVVVQLTPVFPLNLLNYGFGATSMRFWTYFGTTGLVLLLGAALYAGVGNMLPSLAGREELSGFAVAWVVGFGLVVFLLSIHAKRRTRFFSR